MTELPPRAPQMVRKSAYGRTQLFLPSVTGILREVKCMGGVTRHDTANVYHVLPELHDSDSTVCCWHCCEEITDRASRVPLPRVYDSLERVFHVYGATCSPGCAKAYVLEHTTFDRGQHLNVLAKMLREVYGITEPVVETPPRPALRRFGGAFDPRRTVKAQCRLLHPPFVSYCMLVDEKLATDVATESGLPAAPARPPAAPVQGVEEADTFDEPQPPALFDEFKRARQRAASTAAPVAPVAPPPAKRRRPEPRSADMRTL